MYQRFALIVFVLLIFSSLGSAVQIAYPSCRVLSSSGVSIDYDCNGVIDQANNSLFLGGYSASDFVTSLNSKLTPASYQCNGNEVLRNFTMFVGGASGVCVNVSASGGTGNITVDSLSVNTLNFLRPGFVTVQNGDGSLNITNNASMTGGSGDGTGGWTNTSTTTSTGLNFSVQGRLIYQGQNQGFDINQTYIDFSNNYGARWLNNTGGVENGVYLDTNNCWHIGWSIIDCRN